MLSVTPAMDERFFSKTCRRVVPDPDCACRNSRSKFSTKLLHVLLFGLLRNLHKYGIGSFRETLHGRQYPYSLRSLVIESNLYLQPTNQSCISDIVVHFDSDCENLSW